MTEKEKLRQNLIHFGGIGFFRAVKKIDHANAHTLCTERYLKNVSNLEKVRRFCRFSIDGDAGRRASVRGNRPALDDS